MSGPLNFSTGHGARADTHVFSPVRGRSRAKSFVFVPGGASCISMGMQRSVPQILLTEISFCSWLGQAQPGDILEYYRGLLALDIMPQGTRLTERDQAELARLARRAWWAAEKGLVHLMQRRHGADDFSYLAIARQRPEVLPISLSSLLMEAA